MLRFTRKKEEGRLATLTHEGGKGGGKRKFSLKVREKRGFIFPELLSLVGLVEKEALLSGSKKRRVGDELEERSEFLRSKTPHKKSPEKGEGTLT